MPHSLQNKVEPDTTSKILKDKKKQGKSRKWYHGSGELVKNNNVKRQQEYSNKIIFKVQNHNYGI